MSPVDRGPERPQDLLEYERRFWGRGRLVAGVDEAGRGPLAGPVVAAAVILREGVQVDGADDSKQLSAVVREELYEAILGSVLCVGVGAASVREIDRRNILRATTVAMQRALVRLSRAPDHVVVDGLPVKWLGPWSTATRSSTRSGARRSSRRWFVTDSCDGSRPATRAMAGSVTPGTVPQSIGPRSKRSA